ncbi:type II secretion system F family protein [Suttonella ornithocola]|uniref:Cholera toxin secretion protein epsF n=1 Tax=Suttonella ornithocola TaxID=279832 RepID=A0A380MQ28_9GAMM|nr:type II secretion system F family protein [Suttonella ornithocola]SUO94388.1 Cholera toxin secretion protein epsF [Suttonella ornithocola]
MAGTKKDLITYQWKGKNKQGKEISGESAVANEAVLKAFLAKQGLTGVTVKLKPKPLFESKGKIKSKDIVFFTRQMATMLRAGMPVMRALDLVGESIEKPKKMQEMIFDIHDRIQNGASFAEALKAHPLYFDDLYTSLVAAGEDAGMLDGTMDNIALNLEKGEVTKKKVKKALTYPAIVMIFAIVVTAVLMIKVVPVFADFFQSNGGELPAPTKLVMAISNFMIDKGIYLLVAIIIAISAFIYFKKRNKKFQQAVNKLSFRLPLIGGILRTGANARFARTMSTLFDAGVPLMKGLNATAPATGSVMYEEAVYDIRDDVQNGQQMSFAMKNTGLFPTIAVQMTAIGEESGNLGEMLGRVATFYEEELDWRIDNLTSMIEPAIMAFLAIVVGGLLIAMYMPIFNLGNMF